LRDVLPTVTDVSLTDTGSYSSCTSSSCALTPLTGTTTTLAVKAIATDDDADCNETDVSTATLYLCINTTLCNSTIADWNYNVDVITRSSTTCTYEFSVNKTTGTPEFWQLPDDYKFHITITSQAGARTSDPNADGTWTYNTLSAIDYPDTVYFGDGNLDIGEWTNGTELATMTNYGNNILTLNWSVTDPTNGDDTWVLNGTDLLLDDDVAYAEDDTLGVGITAAALNSTDNEFKPGTGLEICTSDSCTASSLNETMDTYYHAYFPEGLSAGEYNTTITITLGDNS